ncbi:hypothetical protein SXIM_52590 [Streptomyces xiamenensis]|uniref:Uncharacterized protein n=1 Tax=Streptomyces xiamenensis TaxID=408015 RepID=A0A0F7G0H5_9ACTN|nr:hypothetical protein SXIM_52590 [Streptomyces xiamenensis]
MTPRRGRVRRPEHEFAVNRVTESVGRTFTEGTSTGERTAH